MSKQLLARYSSSISKRSSELCYDDDWGNYYIYFYDDNGELNSTKTCPGSRLQQAEMTAERWVDSENIEKIICDKYDYIIAKARSRIISIRKVLR